MCCRAVGTLQFVEPGRQSAPVLELRHTLRTRAVISPAMGAGISALSISGPIFEWSTTGGIGTSGDGTGAGAPNLICVTLSCALTVTLICFDTLVLLRVTFTVTAGSVVICTSAGCSADAAAVANSSAMGVSLCMVILVAWPGAAGT